MNAHRTKLVAIKSVEILVLELVGLTPNVKSSTTIRSAAVLPDTLVILS
jgi:hypothetical protein